MTQRKRRTLAESRALARALVDIGAAVSPTNQTGRGHKRTPDGAAFICTGAPVEAFRKCLYSGDSARGLAHAARTRAEIDALWNDRYPHDGVAFVLPAGIVYCETDHGDTGLATAAALGIDTAADGWHDRHSGRGAFMRIGDLAAGLRNVALGAGCELLIGEHVVCPTFMRADAVRIVDAHPAVIAALQAAQDARRQHRPIPTAAQPANAELPRDRAQAYAQAALANAAEELKRATGAGKRHDTLTRYAFKVGRVLHLGLDERAAFDALANAIDNWSRRDRNRDLATLRKCLQAGAAQPYTPHAHDDGVRAEFERFSASLSSMLATMPATGRTPTEHGDSITNASLLGTLQALASLMTTRGIFGTVAASIRCIREARGRGSMATVQRDMSAAVAAGIVRRVGRDTVKWLAVTTGRDPRELANAYAFDVARLVDKCVTGNADDRGGSAQPGAGRGRLDTDAQPRRAGRASIPPPFSQVTVTDLSINRLVVAGAAAGEIEVIRAVAGGAHERRDIVATVVKAGMCGKTARRRIDTLAAAGVLVMAGTAYAISHDGLSRYIDWLIVRPGGIADRREGIRRQNMRERDAFRADLAFRQAVEAAHARPATAAERAERGAAERAYIAQHGRDGIEAWRAAYLARIVVVTDDDARIVKSATAAPAFMGATQTARELVTSAPTMTGAQGGAGLALAARLRAMRGIARGGRPSLGVASRSSTEARAFVLASIAPADVLRPVVIESAQWRTLTHLQY